MARAGTLVLLSLLVAGCGVTEIDPGSELAEERGGQTTANTCQRLENDPYVIAGAARGGASKGKCLDTTLFRTARRLSGRDYREAAAAYRFARTSTALAASAGGSVEQATSFAQLRTLLVANVRHRGTFWVAEIPVLQDSIKGSTFQVEEFIIPLAGKVPASLLEALKQFPEEHEQLAGGDGNYRAAHAMFRLSLAPSAPIVLAPQYPPDASRKESVRELVLSVHAVAHVAGEYDPVAGMTDAYGTALGAYTLQEKVKDVVLRQKHTVRQYRLKLSSSAARAFLLSYLGQALSFGLDTPYNTITRNCGTELFALLDKTLGYNKASETPYAALGRAYPKYAEQALVPRGLLPLRSGQAPDAQGKVKLEQIDPTYLAPTLNDEVQSGALPASEIY